MRSSRREAANRDAPESAWAAHAEAVAELGAFGSACRAGRSRSAAWLPVPRARRVAVSFLAWRRRDRPWSHDRPFGAHTSSTSFRHHSSPLHERRGFAGPHGLSHETSASIRRPGTFFWLRGGLWSGAVFPCTPTHVRKKNIASSFSDHPCKLHRNRKSKPAKPRPSSRSTSHERKQ